MRPTPPWLFLILLAPVGIATGHATVAMPYLLPKLGMDRSTAAAVISLTVQPNAWKPLWTPLLDFWLPRTRWHLLSTLIAAPLIALSFVIPVRHTSLLSAVLLLANIASATSHNVLGGLCATTVHPDQKGRAGGCFSAGEFLSAGLSGGLMLELYSRDLMSPRGIGLLVGGLMLMAALPVLFIQEAPPERRPVLPHVRAILGEVRATLRTRLGGTGLLICLAPVGAVAAANLFGLMADEYRASGTQVDLATGLPAGLAGAVGALLGGRLADRANRRAAYLLSGALTGACALGMALSPATPAWFIGWALAYATAGGLVYATFYAFLFEMIRPGTGATTTYGVFAGAGNLAISYSVYLEGRMYAHGQRLGVLFCDAALQVVGIAFVVLVLRRPRGQSQRPG
jgi:MFS family permease